MWTAFSILNPPAAASVAGTKILRRGILSALAIVTTTILSGGFVAGNDAGLAYNTWPKMLEDWVPAEVTSFYSGRSSFRAFFEDTAVVQFNHRMLAYSSLLASSGVALYAVRCGRKVLSGTAYDCCTKLVPAAVAGQVTLGIITLLNCVPIEYGVAHQGGGVAMWSG